jgi:hypothetical protein
LTGPSTIKQQGNHRKWNNMMSDWRDRLKLAEGDTINLLHSKSTGFMQETDVEIYEIRASNIPVSGTVIFTDHTAIKVLSGRCVLSSEAPPVKY